ncbi:MAG: SpoIIE family protein phosphatase [Verrucomicrobiota bacterium]
MITEADKEILEQPTRLLSVAKSVIPAHPSEVASVRTRFIEFLGSLGISSAEKEGWKLVFTEMVINAIVHGAKQAAAARVTVEWWSDEGQVALAVTDPGLGFDTTRLENAQLPEDPSSENGRGLFILDSFSDQIDPWKGPHGFQLILRKHYDFLNNVLPPNAELERVLDELSACYENLSSFYRLSQSLLESDGAAGFIEAALDDFLVLHPFDSLFIAGMPDLPEGLLAQLSPHDWFLPYGQLPANLAVPIREQKEIIWDDLEDLTAQGLSQLDFSTVQSGCIVPMISGDSYFGSLVALRGPDKPKLFSHDIDSLRTLSDLFGIACANSHLRELRDDSQRSLRELEIAVEIQRQLLPILPAPSSPHYEVIVDQISSLGVAGDYAEAILDSEGNLVVCLIDVMGKGVSAALLASVFRTAFDLCKDLQPIHVLLEAVNDALCRQLGTMTMFVTCAVTRFAKDGSRLEHANAGHCHTLFYDASGKRRELEPSGPPLGLLPGGRYTTEELALVGGEHILFVSDGCYEWDYRGELFGWKRFTEAADRVSELGVRAMWKALQEKIDHHTDSDTRDDDCTLLAVSVKP